VPMKLAGFKESPSPSPSPPCLGERGFFLR